MRIDPGDMRIGALRSGADIGWSRGVLRPRFMRSNEGVERRSERWSGATEGVRLC